MKVYLVGGAIRNKLLGLPIADNDYVVVGSTPEEMISLGFKKVGADFAVFLHPETGEEYALARTERKSGVGYNGFTCDFNSEITLEDDNFRRDLSINALAMDIETGEIIDFVGGLKDLENHILRHTSVAFRDDPLRVLRTARFAAQFHHLGFTIAPETMVFMSEMVSSGELNHLTPERVWVETNKALSTSKPSIYFDVLLECGALETLFPEIFALVNVPQPIAHHPEVDTYIHIKMCLDLAAKRGMSNVIRFAALVHDLGKGITPKELWPKHIGHEESGVDLVNVMCDRLKIPNEFRWMGATASLHHLNVHQCKNLKETTLLKKLILMGALNNTPRFYDLLEVCKIDAQGRLGLEDANYPQLEYLKAAVAALKKIDYKTILTGIDEKLIVDTVYVTRVNALKQFTREYHD